MHKLKELLNRTPNWERRFARKFQILAVARMNELLDRSPLDQKALAEKAGWDKSYVSRLLSGSGGNVTLKTVARFEDALGADVLAVTQDPAPSARSQRVAVLAAPEPYATEAALRSVVASTGRRVTVYAGGDE